MNSRQECGRIEAFSDGVFAIAITLLVLDLIQIPHGEAGESLIQAYVHHWERFLAFAVGFATILVCWINHHHMFTHIRRADSRLMWINGLLLFLVTFIPFPTVVLAEYIGKQNSEAVAMFGFGYFLMAGAYYALWSYVSRHGLLDADGDGEYFVSILATYRYATIYNFVAFFACFASIPLAVALYLVMFTVFAFPQEFANRLTARRAQRR
jgi:uncharacterized membrane protein